MSPALINTLITIALSGGLFTGLAAFINSRSTAKQLKAQSAAVDAKLPTEVDSVAVVSSERAVLSLERALDRADKKVAQLEQREEQAERRQEEAERRQEAAEEVVVHLRRELTDLRRQIDSCNDSLRQAQQRAADLSARLSAIDNGRG